ncbi:phage late control D family protein [Microvirga massiliensis]|uniref:phage late control D family protein n=1 Tax=Microvirga massiliensis TaxID=1033741 RepID=UPI00062B8652|nr:hypothetical protein [Microvirga massiliensis]
MPDGVPPYYVPRYHLELGGTAIPATLQASIASIRHDTGLEGSDRVELTVVNENLRWLDHPLFNLDRSLTLSFGYMPDRAMQVFDGIIVSKTAEFPAAGAPMITVAAQDRKQRAGEGTKSRWFGIPIPTVGNFPLPDALVAVIASAENGLMPMMDPVGAGISLLLSTADILGALGDPDVAQQAIRKQIGESDLDMLERLAVENGWELVIDHDGPFAGFALHFMSPLDRLSTEVELAYGRTLIEFTPHHSKVGLILAVTVTVWVAPIKASFAFTIGWDWDRMAFTVDVRPALMPARGGPTAYKIDEPVTLSTAPRRVISELIPRLNKRLTGAGRAIGDPHIRAGAVIKLLGLGSEFGGLYRVTSATHTIDSAGYLTRFEARKEIWFGSIPAPEQGAVPIRLSGPVNV